MFGVIGYPKIMHSDNGKEFKAKVLFLSSFVNLIQTSSLFMDDLGAPKIRVLLRTGTNF
jgi:hypothetical protein